MAAWHCFQEAYASLWQNHSHPGLIGSVHEGASYRLPDQHLYNQDLSFDEQNALFRARPFPAFHQNADAWQNHVFCKRFTYLIRSIMLPSSAIIISKDDVIPPRAFAVLSTVPSIRFAFIIGRQDDRNLYYLNPSLLKLKKSPLELRIASFYWPGFDQIKLISSRTHFSFFSLLYHLACPVSGWWFYLHEFFSSLAEAYAFGFPIHCHIHPTLFIHLFAYSFILLLISFLNKARGYNKWILIFFHCQMSSFLITVFFNTPMSSISISTSSPTNNSPTPGRCTCGYDIRCLKGHDSWNKLDECWAHRKWDWTYGFLLLAVHPCLDRKVADIHRPILIKGPKGAKVSKLLDLVHCPSSFCRCLAVTSLKHVYPNITLLHQKSGHSCNACLLRQQAQLHNQTRPAWPG